MRKRIIEIQMIERFIKRFTPYYTIMTISMCRSKKFKAWLKRRKKIFRKNHTPACNIARLSSNKIKKLKMCKCGEHHITQNCPLEFEKKVLEICKNIK
jgi:hypothetical protein